MCNKLKNYVVDVFSPSFIVSVMRDRNLSMKKALGQNFLINRSVALSLLDIAQIGRGDTVLEVGPGLGTLTFLMSSRARQVVAVEIDRGFARYLKERIDEFNVDNVRVIQGDFLSLSFTDLPSSTRPDKAVCNFPYSIGIRALIKILEEYESVQKITGTVQREIAMRIGARPGRREYSYVSAYLQFLAEVRIVEGRLGPGNFFPSPEVESSIVDIGRKSGELLNRREAYKAIVKAGFATRRKSLAGNLRRLGLTLSREELKGVIAELFSDKLIRAENLSPEDFMRLTQRLVMYME